MDISKTIEQLESLKLDRESFIQGDFEHDNIFLEDIKALDTAIKILKGKGDLEK